MMGNFQNLINPQNQFDTCDNRVNVYLILRGILLEFLPSSRFTVFYLRVLYI